ncbi:MAG: TIGR03086 family metal-binding protein [Acidimicrobiales bacterium]
MDVRDLHAEGIEAFAAHLAAVPGDGWGWPTPCVEWDVRALVNHVVGENRWLPPLLEGATVADVGDALDGDLLGADPHTAWDGSARAALDAVRVVDLDRIVHLSFADVPASEYLWQLTADLLVHAWDLAHATGQAESIPADVVAPVADWFDSAEDLYRGAGVIGPAVEVDSRDPFAVLLGRFGRDPSLPRPTAQG